MLTRSSYLLIVIVFNAIAVYGQSPCINITYANGPCAPTPVTFEDCTPNSVDTYWDFDGIIMNGSIVINTFSDPGTYSVDVTITLSSGNTINTTETFTIYDAPEICWTASPLTGCAPLTTCFDASCSSGSPPLSVIWDFCDGDSSSLIAPCQTFTSGCFCMTLLVTDANGCQADTTLPSNYICTTDPPVACFSSSNTPASCSAPYDVVFTNCSTPTTGLTYSWQFPGGSPSSSSSQNPGTVTYNAAGSYSVTLTVTDASGCSSTMTVSNFVNIGGQSTCFNMTNDSLCEDGSLDFSACGADTYTWSVTPSGPTISSTSSQNTTITFPSSGNFQVCLNVSLPGGCTAQQCTTIYVTPQPTASFTVQNNTPVCQPPLTIDVTNTSTGAAQWNWSFPGGNPASSTAQNPGSITYNNCGQYDISLTVTAPGGCTDTYVYPAAAQVNCPTASITVTTIAPIGDRCSPLDVEFTATGTGTIYNWNFDYTSGSTTYPQQNLGPNPTWTFATPDCYQVAVQIIDPVANCTATAVLSTPVNVGTLLSPPLAFTIDPDSACAPELVTLEITSIPVSPVIACCPVKYSVYWGDGGQSIFTAPVTTATHQYSDTATDPCFDIMVIRHSCLCYDTLIVEDMVCIFPPITSMQLEHSCTDPLCITANASNSIGVDFFDWSLTTGYTSVTYAPGDIGSNSEGEPNAVATFCFPDSNTSYTITLVGYNTASGCTMQTQQTTITTLPVPSFYFSDTVLCVGETTNVYNTSVSNNSNYWFVYDSTGTQVNYSNQKCFSSASCPGTISFPDVGVYTIRLVIIDANGCETEIVKEDYVTVNGTYPDFDFAPTLGCVPLTVNFQDLTPSTVYGTPVTWDWHFGDGDSSSVQNPTHTYTEPGTYYVELCITDQFGCTVCVTDTQPVQVGQPQIDFFASDSAICLGDQICFISNVTSVFPIATYEWQLGDGDSSNLSTPCHNYLANGTYSVTLTVTDDQECKDSLVKMVNVGSITASFTTNDTTASACPPLLISFINTTAGIDTTSGSGWTCQWFFGDSSSSNICDPFHIYNIAGTFDVTLIVTDPEGCTDTLVMDDYIFVGGPTASVTSTLDTACVPIDICFDANPTNAISFLWCFGDYSSCVNDDDMVCHTYDIAGVYQPDVLLCDGDGCCYVLPIGTIVVDSAHACYTASQLDLCSQGVVDFVDTCSFTFTTIEDWLWDFDDGTIATDSVTQHAFNTTGTYDVILTVTSTAGCTDDTTLQINVTPSPVLLLSTNSPSYCPADTVWFLASISSLSPVDSIYWDFGNGNDTVTVDSLIPQVYPLPGNYDVTVIVMANNGCTDTTSLALVVNPNPVANAGVDDVVCMNEPYQLNGSGGTIYDWQPNVNPSNIANPLVSPTLQTTYTLVVTDANGCTDNDLVVISINPLPQPGIMAVDSICALEVLTVTASGGVSYLWSDSSATNPLTDNPTTTTTYAVTISDANGCTVDTSILVEVLPLPIINAGPDTSVCAGQSVQLFSSGGIIYLWAPDSSLDNSNISNPIAQILDTTTFTVLVTDSFNCNNTDTVYVNLLPLPDVQICNTITTICDSTTILLCALGATTYVWSPSQYLNFDTIQNPIAFPPDTMTFYVTGTDTLGCANADSVVVSVLFPFDAVFASDTCVCIGNCVQLHAEGPNGFYYYTWIPATALDSPWIANPVACPVLDIVYQVVVFDGQCYSDTGDVDICINPLPTVFAGNDTLVLAGSQANLNATGSWSGIYTWSPDSLVECPDCPITYTTPIYLTTYIITLTDDNGCRADDSVIVAVFCNNASIYIPNAFTPDGDGLNDIYYLNGVGFDLKYFRIYDRWGEKVFESTDVKKGWNGYYKGKLYEPEVFVYYLEAICSSGEVLSKKGNITLIR